MDKKAETILTYDRHAQLFARKFDGLSRAKDIEEIFAQVGRPNPKVLEIGCGNGRDAAEILKYTLFYTGIDASENLIRLARKKVPSADFQVADMELYPFPENLDIVIAFASLIHLPKENLKKIFSKAYLALNKGGIFRISMKRSSAYKEVFKAEGEDRRTYYFYSEQDLEALGNGFDLIKKELLEFNDQDWIEMMWRKD